MKVYYTGTAEGPIEAFGVTFENGKAAEVADRFQAKIEGNPYFKAGGDTEAPSGAKPTSGPKAPKEPKAPKGAAAPTQQPSNDGPATYEAKHRGFGKYSIMLGDKEVVEGLTKDDAEAFNALSDDDKAKYVDNEG